MGRGLIGGVVSGVVVAGLGLGALSVLSPVSQPRVTASEGAPQTAPASEPVPDPVAAPQASEPAGISPAPDATPKAEIMLLPDGSQVAPPQAAGSGARPQVFAAGQGGGFSNAPGTVVNRLPSVGRPAGMDTGEAPLAVAPAAGGKAIERFSAPPPQAIGRPMMSVVLYDVGEAAGGLDPQTIASLGLPVTVALDPTQPDVAERARRYRAAGLEVAVLAAGIPEGATVQDVATAMEAWRQAVPEAVAVLDGPSPQFQNNRILSQQVVAGLKAAGEGLMTQSAGLDSAGQVARAKGVPQIQLWRVADAGREDRAEIGRTLDRAAFEGERKNGVAVMLSAWPESVAALTDWAASMSGKIVLAPASALMLSRS